MANILKLIDFYLSVETLQSIIATLDLLSRKTQSICQSSLSTGLLTYFDHQKKSKTWQNILKILVEINLEALCPNKTMSSVETES